MRLLPNLLLAAGLGLAGAASAQAQEAPWPTVQRPTPLPGTRAAPILPTTKPPPLPPGTGTPAPGARRAASTGTGFVVAPGRLLTNWHVAEGCTELRARGPRGAELPASLAARDAERDLALLALPAELGPPLAFRAGPEVRRGEGVVTYGFPFAGMLSSGATLTTGDISALSGLRDNPRHFQISAPVQAGNSGGPLLDMGGRVIGVVVSKLNAQRIAQVTGDLPQNVNFAVKGSEAVDFLLRNGIRPATAAGLRAGLTPADVGELAEPSTVLLRCLR
ncbi:S1 family peptidase [Paracraurococcus lichenis]|uniref:Serine protease n=1 Tax=Paracraurococcus lichenis TaxID=3064888 RepID=A0ABT9E3J8_9PROT|nr:serine protease [Paracraurococcus sp. LOR1-02]MDO9710718.1 serine protease [Paracraurococcus sp. LOR1-02]